MEPGTYGIPHVFLKTAGKYPEARMVVDKAGNLYGTTAFSHELGVGIVFKFS
jgi:hypothetical protein